MNCLFSLLLLFLFIPKGHQFVQENFSDDGDDANDLDVEGTDGIDLEKVYGQYYATEATIDSENVENTLPPSVKTDENGGNSEFLPTTAPATAIEASEENLSPDDSERQSNRKEYSMFSKDGSDAVVESNSNVEHGKKKKSPKVSEKNTNLAVGTSNVNNKGSTRMDNRKNALDGGHTSVLSEKLKFDSKNQKPVERDEENKFQMKKEGKSESGIIAVKSEHEQNVNLQENSTAKPPYVMKHKMNQEKDQKQLDDIYFLFIVIGCSVAGIAGLALAGYCWYKLHTTAKAVSEAEYPGTYGAVSGKQPVHLMQSGDQKLDYNAEMYHYQHTKNQLAAMEKAGGSRVIKGETLEDEENSDEGDEGDYTVYECPGLAPAGDMTVVNPMFSDQEQVASDQDANGTHSGRSAEGSPSFSRHAPKE